MTSFDDLTKPSKEKETRARALLNIIQSAIQKEKGAIPFSTYMALALYHPKFGYYTAHDFAIGKMGDFTTAPEITPLFARTFAAQCADILSASKTENILELGAGSGQFASDLLIELARLNALPRHYYIYEISASLRQKQRQKLQAKCPSVAHLVIFLDELPHDFEGVILGNEVLDALPVNLFRVENKRILERVVTECDGELSFDTREAPSFATSLPNHLPEGYESEINLQLAPFIERLSRSLKKGVILLADYGYGRQEFYSPRRQNGTLSCFYQHQRVDNPLIWPGLLDITAHVDFTTVIETAHDAHCQLAGFTTQAAFLLANGLLTLAGELEKTLSAADQVNLHHAIKTLTLPTEMGEVIKIIGLSKECDFPIRGFSFQDRRRDL